MGTKNNWERVLCTLSQCPCDAWLIIAPSWSTAMWSILDIFSKVAMPRKHCNTFGRCSDGIDVHNDFEYIFKVDWNLPSYEERFRLRSSWPLLYFPATKENINYTLYGPPCVKKFRNLGMVPKISQWFRKFGMVPKIRDGLDLRNNYENVVILSTFEIFSKIARNAAETLDAEHRKETGNDCGNTHHLHFVQQIIA